MSGDGWPLAERLALAASGRRSGRKSGRRFDQRRLGSRACEFAGARLAFPNQSV